MKQNGQIGNCESKKIPMMHKEGKFLCIPLNVVQENGVFKYDNLKIDITKDVFVEKEIVGKIVYNMEQLLNRAIQTFRISEEDALTMTEYYPEWNKDTLWNVGDRCLYKGRLFQRQQPCNSPEIDPPSINTASLWKPIDEKHDGTMTDPIPYQKGMVLENKKYYEENGIIYLCNRDSGSQVFNDLKDLVSVYVEVVEP